MHPANDDVSAVLRDDATMQAFMERIFETWIIDPADIPRVGLVRYTGELEVCAMPMVTPDMTEPLLAYCLRQLATMPEKFVHDAGLDNSFVGVSLLSAANLESKNTAEMTVVGRNNRVYDITFLVSPALAASLPVFSGETGKGTKPMIADAAALTRALHSELAAHGMTL